VSQGDTNQRSSLRATGSRESAPDGKLREAIQSEPKTGLLRRFAPRNDGGLQFERHSGRATREPGISQDNIEIPGLRLEAHPGMTGMDISF
jgi:hypothetical protein